MLRIYEFFIETRVNHEKNDYIDKRHLLVCDNCYWCLSCLPDLENNQSVNILMTVLNVMPKLKVCIFERERESKNVDFRHRENILAQSENWIIY